MKVYEGQLKRLGNAKIAGNRTIYSLVEIGDQIIKNVVVNNNLDNFLSDGLKTGQSTKLWTIKMGLTGSGLAGLQVAGGKTYMAAPFSFFGAIFMLAIGLLFGLVLIFSGVSGLPYVGVALVAFSCWMGYRTVFQYLAVPKSGAVTL